MPCKVCDDILFSIPKPQRGNLNGAIRKVMRYPRRFKMCDKKTERQTVHTAFWSQLNIKRCIMYYAKRWPVDMVSVHQEQQSNQ